MAHKKGQGASRNGRDTAGRRLGVKLPVPEEIQGAGRNLHAPPSIIGNIAARTKTKKLVLSHFMARSLKNLEQNLKQVQSRYSGTLTIAGDLDCIGF